MASEMLKNIGSPEHWIPTFNRGLLLLGQGRFDEARPEFEDAMAEMAKRGRMGLKGALHTALLPCLAHDGSWDDWDDHMAKATDLLGRSGFVDPDVAQAAEVGARVAEERGQSGRALDALKIADAQWRALGNNDRGALIAQRISALHARVEGMVE